MSQKTTLPVARASELAIEPEKERWLIRGFWGRSAIVLIRGTPKSCKSWLGLEMAMSVASGSPALGHFTTDATGPALVYLAEDSLPQVRARVEALCRHRGIDIEALDLHVITAPVLRIDLAADQERLAATIDRLCPRIVLLDPLVQLHRLDENSSSEISGLLGYIRDLQRRFDVAVVLVHHASKKARAQPGQALRGSSDLHAIGDSNAYLARRGDRLVLTLKHRAARSPEPLEIRSIWINDGFIAAEQVTPDAPWMIRVTDELRSRFVEDAPSGYVTMSEAMRILGVSRQTMLQRVKQGKLDAVHVRLGRRKGLRIKALDSAPSLFDPRANRRSVV